MQRRFGRFCISLLLVSGCVAQNGAAPRSVTWQEAKNIFRANNPTLLAGQLNIDEARADEITAYLRPNPTLALSTDGIQIAPSNGSWRPLSGTLYSPSLSYLHERERKRELRLESARRGTAIATSTQADLERNLLFSLRDSFNRVLLAKAIAGVAVENLTEYDRQIAINQERFKVGAISRVDLQRVEIQRVQFESDLATANVNLRTAKIDLLNFLHSNTPVEHFDVKGEFDFTEPVVTLADLRDAALEQRPDLREAQESLSKARTDHQLAIANGSTDPTFGAWYTHNGSFNNPDAVNTMGASVSFPLRIFDRNQGEKLKTELDIGRNQKLRDAAENSVTHDVDSAYATLESTLTLLRPYKERYLKEASDIRATVSFAYEHGAASLLDFLDAQKEYRDVQVNYLNLLGAYFSAGNQLNLAVGREVIQ